MPKKPPATSATNIRVSVVDRKLLDRLCAKTGLRAADVWRQGLRALAREHGLEK